MLQIFGFFSGILVALAFIPYVKDILLFKTKPQRTSFFIWSVLGGIAFFSQFAKGASYSLLLPGSEILLTIVIFLLSLRYGVGGFGKKDYIALFIAALGLIAWYYTKEAAIALYIVIIIDAAGSYLTIHKAYKDPGSETLISWAAVAIAGVFAMFAVGSFNTILLSYPFYIFLANAAVVVAMKMGSGRKN